MLRTLKRSKIDFKDFLKTKRQHSVEKDKVCEAKDKAIYRIIIQYKEGKMEEKEQKQKTLINS